MPLKLFLTFDVESKRSHNYITCEHVPGAPGIYWIMDELERHQLRGVFFVNVYEHTLYPDGWMRDLLRQIDARGTKSLCTATQIAIWISTAKGF